MDKGEDVPMKHLKGFIRKGARAKSEEWVSTGHFNLDFAVAYGQDANNVDLNDLSNYDPTKSLGLPAGRLVEIFGAEAGGKSSLAYRVCGYAQKAGGNAAWIDTEHSFKDSLAELNGVDIDELWYSSLYDENDPDKNFFAEDVMDNIVELCKEGFKVVVLDSVANLIPREVDEKNADQLNIAKLARILSAQLGKVAHYASKNNVLVIFINQLREKPGVIYGSPFTTPGGRSLKFNASVRLEITKKNDYISVGDSDDEQEIIGHYSNVIVVKNRMAPPLVSKEGKRIPVIVPIYYKPYFPNLEERLFESGRQLKLIKVRKGTYSWEDVKIDGRDAFISHIRDNDLIKPLLKSLVDLAVEEGVILPPEIVIAGITMDENDGDKAKRVPGARKKSDS